MLEAHGVWDICYPYWEAFQTLSRSRTWTATLAGLMPNGLVYSEIAAYARDHGLADEIDDVVMLLQELDYVWMEYFVTERGRARG